MTTSVDKQTLVVITGVGLAATVAQLAVLREMLVLVYGIELFMGPVLACWLVWNGVGCSLTSRYAHCLNSPKSILGTFLSIAAVLLPSALFFIRIARSLWHIAPGELPTMGCMLSICILVTALPSLISGALFGLCWVFSGNARKTVSNRLPFAVYMGEALGAAMGGIAFYIFFVSHQPLFTAIWSVSCALLLVAGWVLLSPPPKRPMTQAGLVWLICASMVVCGVLFRKDIETLSRKLQWGGGLIAVEDTAFQNLSVIRNNRQYSVFSNGLWRYSVPDQLSNEFAVHPALLQHPAPRSVLMLGSNGVHTASEALKHHKGLKVDIVEIDPNFIRFYNTYLTTDSNKQMENPRIMVHHQDALRFINRTNKRYHVVIMSLGDPINAQMNRFYTVSFFQKIKKVLAPNGVFALSVTGGEDMLGEDQIIFLKSVLQTLETVFPKVVIFPGERIQFFSTSDLKGLLQDPEKIAGRIYHRNLSLSYVRPDTLQILLAPFRLQYFNSILKNPNRAAINTDLSPVCYRTALRLLTAQWHPTLKSILNRMMRISKLTFWGMLLFLSGLLIITFFLQQKAGNSPIYLSVGVTGAVTLALQMVLLLAFQNYVGMLYLHMVLIIAAFMVGLASGAGWSSKRYSRLINFSIAKKQLIIIQTLLLIYPLFLSLLFIGMHQFIQENLLPFGASLLFSFLSLVSGILGGLHFSSATALMHVSENPSLATGGYLYAVDLVGAAGGVLLTTLCLIPLLGPLQTLPVLSFAAGICLIILVQRMHVNGTGNFSCENQ